MKKGKGFENWNEENNSQYLDLEEKESEVTEETEDSYDQEEIEESVVDTSRLDASYKALYTKKEKTKIYVKPKLMSMRYIAIALIAALVGGIISMYLAPQYIYGKLIPIPDMFMIKKDVYELQIQPDEDIMTTSAVVIKAIESVVGITTLEIEEDWVLGEREYQGIGSGIVISEDGYILTNSHVIGDGNARSITVRLGEGKKKEAEIKWFEPIMDLAIIKVDAEDLIVAELGNSDKLSVGELAIAIGNPLGVQFERTVTAGIISGLNRSVSIDDYNLMENLIQTDASINPGNSGGPLLNSKGQVIGINTAKIKTAEGLGLTVPINEAKPIIQKVLSRGEFEAVYLGIVGRDVDVYKDIENVDISSEYGVIIMDVEVSSPAQKAGLMFGDIIISMNEKNIRNMNDLKIALSSFLENDKIVLTVIRNNSRREIEVVLKERPKKY